MLTLPILVYRPRPLVTFSQFDMSEFDSCIACGRGRGGADAYFCEVCLDNGAPELVLNDSPFFTRDLAIVSFLANALRVEIETGAPRFAGAQAAFPEG